MIICKDKCYAYTGETVAEAYENYMNSGDDNDMEIPEKLEWFSATPMKYESKLIPIPAPKPVKK